MKIGIFGGSFNPPHKIHQKIATSLIDEGYLDRVIFVPTGDRYNKNDLINAKDRYNMLSLLIKNNSALSVSSFEIKNNLVFTYETLRYFKNKYKTSTIYFICGSDNLKEITKWKNFKEILSNYKILVIKRNNDNFNHILKELKDYNKDITFVTIPYNNVSSTSIRDLLKKSSNQVLSYIDKDILNYIKTNNLYESKKCQLDL